MNVFLAQIRELKAKSGEPECFWKENGLSEQDLRKIAREIKEKFDRVTVMNETDGTLSGYDCSICRNKGVIYCRSESGEIVSQRCKCMKIRDSIWRIKTSGLNNLLHEYTFQNYNTEEEWQKTIKSKAVSFVKNSGKWFFIGGQIGCGKSHICTAIVGQCLKQGKRAKYMQWRDDVVNLKANAASPQYSDMINPFKNAEVLYIDDLFKTETGKAPTTADINIAFEIINRRYINPNFITIISSEKIIPELIQIDEAVASRICERTGDYIVNVSPDIHKNYRLKGVI